MGAHRRGRLLARHLLALAAIAVPLAAGAGPAAPDSQQRGLALLARASLIGDLRSVDSPPFRLRARVRVSNPGTVALDGEYALSFAAPDRWSVRLAFPGHAESRGAWEGMQWRKRDNVERPYRFEETFRLLDIGSHLGLAPEATIREVLERNVGARHQLCATITPAKEIWQRVGNWGAQPPDPARLGDSSYDLCFDGDTGMLVEARYEPPLPRLTFEGVVTLSNKAFPNTLRCWEGDDVAVEASVVELAPADAEDLGAATPPTGAESWPACAEPVPPRLVERPAAPRALRALGQRRLRTATFFAEVGRDGVLNGLTPLGPIAPAHADLVRAALAAWRYQPATCNGVPVPMVLYLTVPLRR